MLTEVEADDNLTNLTHLAEWALYANTIKPGPGNTKGESITVPLTSCLTGLD
jgi:hypothetical protein